MERAVQFLGHPHVLTQKVAHGKKIGSSTLGFPTVNLHIPEGVIVPAFGVYTTKSASGGEPYRRYQRGGAPYSAGRRPPGDGGGLHLGL